MTVASLRNVSFSYDSGVTYILRNFSLVVDAGKHVVVTGKNGSGKSTLAKIVSGLLAPDDGVVELLEEVCYKNGEVDAKAYANARKNIAYVSQDPSIQLLCENVASDVAFIPQNLQFSPQKIDEAVILQLKKAGLEDIAEADPATLSGGQQQLVALASAIVADPELLVLDEPTSFLDEENSKKFLRLLEKCAGERTIFHVAHKAEEVVMADEVVRI